MLAIQLSDSEDQPLRASGPAREVAYVPSFRSLGALHQHQAETRGDAIALRHWSEGAWHSVSWREWHRQSRALAAALLALGVVPGDRVAVLASTGLQWAEVDLAAQLIGAVVVPIYLSSTADQVCFILKDCDAKVVLCEDAGQLAKVVQHWSSLPSLERVLSLSASPDPVWSPSLEPGFLRRALAEPGPFVPAWDQLLAFGQAELDLRGKKIAACLDAVTPDSLATILYTSGTTGVPKGVLLSHGNLLYVAEAFACTVELDRDDELLIVVPLAHITGRFLLWANVFMGLRSALAADLTRFMEHARSARPTHIVCVPRMFEKAALALRGATPADVLRAFGGRVRLLVSGGAALAPGTARFFADAGLPIGEGWGLTESSGPVTVDPVEPRMGSVGRALPGAEIRIAADGEVLTASPGVMRGYHHRPEQSREALREIDGKTWLCTGDVGRLDADGYLWITDRKKDLFKTSGGKYIAPQALENALKSQSRLISHVAICGSDRKYVTALVTLNEADLLAWGSERGYLLRYEELLRRPEVEQAIQADVDAVNRQLASFETIKYFRILPRDFTIAAGELTVTAKLRRRAITERYAELIEQMYRC